MCPTSADTYASSRVRSPLALTFTHRDYETLHVEYVVQGKDFIYHFWPAEGRDAFCPNFHRILEDGFKEVLPESAQVAAEFFDKVDCARNELMRSDKAIFVPMPSFYVRVIGWAGKPMADQFLTTTVFEFVNNKARELTDDHQPEVRQLQGADPGPQRAADRRRHRRRPRRR